MGVLAFHFDRPLLAVFAGLALSCSSEALGDDASPAPVEPTPLPFEACPRFSDTGEGVAECLRVARPLLRSDPEGEQIELFVKRLPATEARRGQLWILPGGPGATSRKYEGVASEYAERLPDLDVYVLDHRGVGQSTALSCEAVNAGVTLTTIPPCGEELEAAWGARLFGFRTTEAAFDVAELIRLTRRDSDAVFAHGGSYGGYWLNRLLSVAPELVDAAIFESSSRAESSGGAAGLAREVDEVARRLFEFCASDAECAARFGADPYARALEIAENLSACPRLDSVTREQLADQLTLALGRSQLRETIPAFFHRAARCSAEDEAWLGRFFIALLPGPEEPQPAHDFGRALNLNITGSEMRGPLDEQALVDVAAATIFNTVRVERSLSETFGSWPSYGPDEFSDVRASTAVPVLVAHGGMDTVTGPSGARAIAEHLGSAAQFVDFPSARHGVYQWPDGENCGGNVMVQFLQNPEQPLDLSCIDAATGLSFDLDPGWLIETFGTDDLWGDP